MGKPKSKRIITEDGVKVFETKLPIGFFDSSPKIIPLKALSYGELERMARSAFSESLAESGHYIGVVAVYPDSLICYNESSEYYRVPYTISEGEYTFAPQEEWQRVEQEWIDSNLKAVTKSEKDGDHPASHYLVVEDSATPSTWHLRVRDMDGNPDHGLMGAAWAALNGGYRGNKYEGPEKQAALSKLKKLYGSEGMDLPAKAVIDLDAATELAFFGGAVKAVGGGKIEGYLVRFGSPKDTDAEGEYFSKSTDFDIQEGAQASIYYHHGMDPVMKRRKLGRGTMRVDELGVWVEGQLDLRDQYEKAIYAMAEQGKLGWSSGTAGHLVDRQRVGKAVHITAWPLGADASLTPTPAELRNAAVPVKSLSTESILLALSGTDNAIKTAQPEVPKSVEWDRAELRARALLVTTEEG